jgi:hypothetical protein
MYFKPQPVVDISLGKLCHARASLYCELRNKSLDQQASE